MRTLSANLQAAMDLTIFTPYMRVHIGSEVLGELSYSVQPIKYKLEATRASFSCVPPSTTFANMSKFYLERGAIINGSADTINSSYFQITELVYDGKFIHVQGSLFLQRLIGTLGIDYNSAIQEFGETSNLEITAGSYEGTPAWKNYAFLPSTRTINNPENALALLRQKYLLFIREEGHTDVGEHFSQISVFCATDTRTQDYTITDQLFKYNNSVSKRKFLWRDENNTVHNQAHPSGLSIIQVHNLGYIESTDAPPNNIDSPMSDSKAIVPINLKYQRGDYVTINSGTAGDIHEYTGRIDVIEIFDIDKEPAWYNEIIPLVHYDNTEGGSLPSTIERVAAYTPLVTTNFNGNLDETVNNLQSLADKVDDHNHDVLAPVQAPTVTNDFLIGAQVASVWTWVKNTLAQTITVLRTSLDSVYAPIAKGVTNGDSHDHNGGDGAAITDANLSTSDIATNNAATSKHGFLLKLDNALTNYMNGQGAWRNPVAPLLLSAHALGATVPASTTHYIPPPTTSMSATLNNTITTLPGTLKNFYVRTGTAQPASGTMVCTVFVNSAATAVTFTIAAGGAAGNYSDTTHSVSVSAGDRIAFECKNNATGASATIGALVVELDVATV